MAEPIQFRFPTDIRFGAGARSALERFAADHEVTRPLLVTDSGLVATAAFALLRREMDRVWPDAWECFSQVHPNPLDDDVEGAWEMYADGLCDGIVGLGGGSALDAAKALRLKVARPDEPLARIDTGQLPAELVPFCAIPTTAGTGSEVGRSSVITVRAVGRKVVFGVRQLMPDMAILDPELTVGLPPHLTAATGMDALTHAVESFVCPVFHPICDAIALGAVRLVGQYLPRAYRDGSDIEARGYMLIAAAMGAISFQKDLGVAHSLAHPLSTEHGIHHGLANAIVLPATVRFNGEENSGQYARVAEALGVAPGADPARELATFLDRFNASLGITQRLRDLGVPREALAKLAGLAMVDGCHLTNPRHCQESDMLRLYEEVW